MERKEQGKNAILDALVVGAGFSGLYMLHRLRQQGFTAHVVEAASGVGGTWYWNRYPGCRCDIPSVEYSYSFSPELEGEWRWTERYAAQPEILQYLEHVADRFDLRQDISFNTRVTAARWNDTDHHWTVELDTGATLEARFLILATGSLSAPKLPDWPGIERFKGDILHTAKWRTDVDLKGKKVAVVGTGSSGIQVIPPVAEMAESLTVFQRTPNFAVPAGNRPLSEDYLSALKPKMKSLREQARGSFLGFFDTPGAGAAKDASPDERNRTFEKSWHAGTSGLLLSYEDLLLDEQSNAAVTEFARDKIKSLISDPETAKRMTPTGYPLGSRRLCSEIGFYDAMNRDNVTLVDVREELIVEVTEHAVVTDRQSYDLDAIIFATGFFAMTGAIDAIEIRGRDNRLLKDDWADGPRAYLGLAVSGFPNLFTVTGPGSPSVLSNMVVSIEQHVDWITQCLTDLRGTGASAIEADEAAEMEWMDHANWVAQQTLFPKANSWYHGRTRDGRKVFMPYVGGVGAYRDKCAAVAKAGYEGFRISGDNPAATVTDSETVAQA